MYYNTFTFIPAAHFIVGKIKELCLFYSIFNSVTVRFINLLVNQNPRF